MDNAFNEKEQQSDILPIECGNRGPLKGHPLFIVRVRNALVTALALILSWIFLRPHLHYVTWTPLCTLGRPSLAADDLVLNEWRSCGSGYDGFDCANFTVPLDHHNESDSRTIQIALTRLKATNTTHRQGAIFINPGGPGGSGTATAFTRGPFLRRLVRGQFDIIGFDPRGINLTRPYVSCFPNKLAQDVFSASSLRRLNLPSTISSENEAEVREDLGRQIAAKQAATKALAMGCEERTGADYLAFTGTDAVVHDIDYLSRKVEGDDMPVNFWGFSYGTIIGQYLVKILPPERIGRVIIDGVVNPTVWSSYASVAFSEGLDNVDDVLRSFALSCAHAGGACALSHLTPYEILRIVDSTIDSLYANPRPIFDLPTPAIATAANLRSLLFGSMYNIMQWPDLATHLLEASKGNFTGIVNKTMAKIDPEGADKPDTSASAGDPIWCNDVKDYDSHVRPPSTSQLVDMALEVTRKYSTRMGDGFFDTVFCHSWSSSLSPRRSRYNGTFELEDGTLKTPILVLSNTYDPVTSLASAIYANNRLGSNARLIQQADGWGHCSLSQVSFCTARRVRDYMADGVVQTEKHKVCDVDQKPFTDFDNPLLWGDVEGEDAEETELREAWAGLANVMQKESGMA